MKQQVLTRLLPALLLGLLWASTSCTRPSARTPANYKGRQLMLGRGGGVTGFTTTYYLLANGKLFTRSSRDTVFTFIGRQTGAKTKETFAMAEKDCAIKTTTFDHPGNMYRFAQWKKGEQSYKVTWGEAGKPVPANYTQLYNSFMAMVPATRELK